MTEHRPSAGTSWLLVLLGLIGSGFAMYWATSSYNSSAADVNDSADTSEEVDSSSTEPDTPSAATLTGDLKSDKPKPPLGQITVLVPSKKFKKEGPNKALRVGFDDVDIEKVLNTKKLSLDLPNAMPEWLQNLNGQRVRMRGYMHPGSAYQADGIKRFIFCRDTSACCFGPDPTIYYLIMTTMKSGTSINYIEGRQFDMEGVFRIDPILDEKSKTIPNFYYLDDAQMVKR